MAVDDGPWDLGSPGSEHDVVTAEWMLGRLAVAQASAARLQRTPDLDPTLRDLLLGRSLLALADLQGALEDIAGATRPLHAGLEGPQLPPLDVVLDLVDLDLDEAGDADGPA